MNSFSITVNGFTRPEYYHACHETGRRLRILLAISMVAICGLIIVFTGNVTLSSVLVPIGIYILVVAGYELLPRITYKDQLGTIDPPVEYDFNGNRWSIKKGDSAAEFEWKVTPRLHRTKLCLFIYHNETSCNLIPLRLLTEQQAASLETWFAHTRDQYKAYRKKEDQAAREKFRKEHSNLRLGRTGPAWGPRKRK